MTRRVFELVTNRSKSRAYGIRRVFERYLKEGEERQLFQTVNQFKSVLARRDYAWMRFMRQTGIRVETMAGLSVGDATAALRDRYLILRPEITKRSQGRQGVSDQ